MHGHLRPLPPPAAADARSWSTPPSPGCALIPGNLEDGRRNLRAELVPAIFLDRAANQARAGARYVREILPAQVEDAIAAGSARRSGRSGGVGLRRVRRASWRSMRPNATGEFPLGEERYSALLREKELLGFGARELRERGQAAYDELAAELDPLRPRAARHRRLASGPRRAQRGSPDARPRRCASATRSGPSEPARICASIGW